MKSVALPLPLTWIQPFDFQHKLGICERIFGKTISSYGVCWVNTGAGITWKLDLTNPTHRWIVYGKYEGESFINWATKFLPKDGIIVDSGANIGQMLMYLSQWIPNGKVLAFEPGNEAANWLAECLAAHKNLPVELLRYGLGAYPAKLRLQNIGDHLGHGAWNQISETEGEEIEIVRLADELAARNIPNVHLWKLDVEGYEIPALQGAETLLHQQRIKAIYAELAGDNGQRVRDYLANFGYYCYFLNQQGKPYLAKQLPEHTNGLFLPTQKFSENHLESL
ncbi:methyltransferase FkbM [Anabaenopsis circularis NIES-21]|uniref:Methyltransferase FkbM n=1 Tax=Anabaenopsis circularis NIES-21 TaxID=1085406 RepID=A0A1Z4GM12_9CYAN|nr:methyltransferase FkbM [Anabaenopsis circularis NIES-21]